ncbi:hypothetical protein [Kineobactrum sediminis]|nr:hypothetical protein [Kineobactrum sediminis]
MTKFELERLFHGCAQITLIVASDETKDPSVAPGDIGLQPDGAKIA